jgi:hypothetical protein
MSQPRRKRRRRRRGGGNERAGQQEQPRPAGEQPKSQSNPKSRRRRRRRGRRGRAERPPASPGSSEDLVRALPADRPDKLTAPHDGVTLEEVIGELQSSWGVPQYPQEYRLTIKVAEERDVKAAEPSVSLDSQARQRAEEGQAPAGAGDGPIREKAPAPPLLRESAPPPGGPRRRKRGRGRRRRGKGPSS